jgi:hypothetical protein
MSGHQTVKPPVADSPRATSAGRGTPTHAVTEQDIRAVARALLKRAKAGEIPAIRELLDRLLGKAGDASPEGAGGIVLNVVTGLPPDD